MLTPTVPTPAVTEAPAATRAAAPMVPESPTAIGRRALSATAMSDGIWVPLIAGVLVLAAGVMTLATKRPWLFVALGPSAMLLASNPGHPTTRFHAVVLGHVTGFLSGCVALLLLGATDAPGLLSTGVPLARIWASAFAIVLTAVVQPSLRAYHPPAAATALLVTLGVHKLTMANATAMLGGLLVVAVLGEWFQRVRLQQQRRAGA